MFRLHHVAQLVLKSIVLVSPLLLAPFQAEAKGGIRRGCPGGLAQRTPEETIEEHVALIAAGKTDEAMCDYAPNATVILPGQVIKGLENIRAGMEGFESLLGGAVPEVTSMTVDRAFVLLTFQALGTPCEIRDGADTYVVRAGHIVTQTVHAPFSNAEGFECPVLAAPQP